MTIMRMAFFFQTTIELCAIAVPLFAPAAIAHAQTRSVAQPVDAVVAIVGGDALIDGVDVIMQSDVEFRARLHMASRDRALAVDVRRAVPAGLLRSTIDELIAEALISREAARVRMRAPSAVELTVVQRRLEDETGGADHFASLCRALGVQANEIDAIVRRRAMVDAFLRANLEGTTTISDAEVERVYAAGEHPFVGAPVDAVREELRAWIAERALQNTLTRWVNVLRARMPVRLVRAPASE